MNLNAMKVILWYFYPMATLVAIECFARGIDDDDDQGGGKMITIFQGVEN